MQRYRVGAVVVVVALILGGVFALGRQSTKMSSAAQPLEIASAAVTDQPSVPEKPTPVAEAPQKNEIDERAFERMKAQHAQFKAMNGGQSSSDQGEKDRSSSVVGTWEGSSIGGRVSVVFTADGKVSKFYAGMRREATWSVAGRKIAFTSGTGKDRSTEYGSLISATQMDFGGCLLTKVS